MEKSEAERDGPMVLLMAEVTLGMEKSTQKKKGGITLESGKKIAGREFSLCLENTICNVCKASRRS